MFGGGLLVAKKLSEIDEDGLNDRVYRLRHNVVQQSCDLYTIIGALAGAVVLKRPCGGILKGAAVGVVAGTATFIAVSYGLRLAGKSLDE